MAAGHAGDVEACAAYLHEHEIACALAHPFFAVAAPLDPRHRRRLAELFADLGGPQRLARAGAEHARRGLRRDPRRHRRRRLRRSRRRRHRPHLDRDARQPPTPEEFLAHLRRGDASSPAASRAAPPSGPTRRWRSRPGRCCARATHGGPAGAARSRRRSCRWPSGWSARAASASGEVAADLGPEDARALLAAWLERVGLEPAGRDADRADAARRLPPRRPLPPRPPHPRARARARRSSARPATAIAPGRRLRRPSRGLFEACMPVGPVRARRSPSSARAAKLAAARRRVRAGGAGRRRRSARCTGSPTRSSRSASAGCPASRSR